MAPTEDFTDVTLEWEDAYWSNWKFIVAETMRWQDGDQRYDQDEDDHHDEGMADARKQGNPQPDNNGDCRLVHVHLWWIPSS